MGNVSIIRYVSALVATAVLTIIIGRLLRNPLTLLLSPKVPLPEGISLSTREQIIYRYYIHGLRRSVKDIHLVGKPDPQPIHTIYMHVRLCDARGEQYRNGNAVNIYQAIDASTDPILVTGEPGAGKTVLTKYLVNRVLTPSDIRLDPNLRPLDHRPANQWVPIFVDLKHNARQGQGIQIGESFEKWLARRALLEQIEKVDKKGLKIHIGEANATSLLMKILDSGRAFIILDGLEGFTSKGNSRKFNESFTQGLKTFAQQHCCQTPNSDAPKSNLLLITARPGEASHFNNWDRFEILPLTPTYQAKYIFLRKLLTDDSKTAKIAETMITNTRMRQVTGNPLFLSMFAYLLQKQSATDLLQEPFTRASLYERFIIERWTHHHVYDPPITLEVAQEILGKLAYEMLDREDKRLAVLGAELDRCIGALLKNKRMIDISTQDVRWELVDRTEYLYPIDPMTLRRKQRWWHSILGVEVYEMTRTDPLQGRFAFLHFTFQEFFAYRHLCSNPPEDITWVCDKLADSCWQETMAMYLSQQPNAPLYIRHCMHPGKPISNFPWGDSQFSGKLQSSLGELDLRAIRNLLLDCFSPQELQLFCLEREVFRPAVQTADGLYESDDQINRRISLRHTIEQKFNKEELRTLCFDLGVDYENVLGESKEGKVVGLINYLERHGRISELISIVERRFPDVTWHDTPEWALIKYCDQNGLLEDLLREVKLIYPYQPALGKYYTISLKTLFLLARIVREYGIEFEEPLKSDPSSRETYHKIRSEIVGQIITRVETVPQDTVEQIPTVDTLSVGDLLSEEDWQRVQAYLEPTQPIAVRSTAAALCGKIGGDQAIALLLQCIDDQDDGLSTTAVRALQLHTSQASDQILEIIHIPSSERQREKALDVISASENIQALDRLLSLTTETTTPHIRDQIKRAIIEIAHDAHTGTIHPRLLGYPRNPDASAYQPVFEILAGAGERAIESLQGRLCDPTQRNLHPAILDILSEIGAKLADSNTTSHKFKAMIHALLQSGNPDEVCFALKTLGHADLNWGGEMLLDLCPDLSKTDLQLLVQMLERLPQHPHCGHLLPFSLTALEHLSSQGQDKRIRRNARKALSRLQAPSYKSRR